MVPDLDLLNGFESISRSISIASGRQFSVFLYKLSLVLTSKHYYTGTIHKMFIARQATETVQRFLLCVVAFCFESHLGFVSTFDAKGLNEEIGFLADKSF